LFFFTSEFPYVMKIYNRPLLLFGVMILLLKDLAAQCDSSYFRYTATLINDAVVLHDTSKIIGVGDNGYIIKSTDGGRNWKNIPTFQPYYLRAIHSPTDSILYTVGSWRTVLKSENQGESWYPLNINLANKVVTSTGFYNDVFFINKDKGFVVGDDGVVATTLDGGRSWKDTAFSGTLSSRLNCVTFVNDTLGFISGGSNALFRTKNGGQTWEKINIDFIGFNVDVKKVKFLNTLTGFAVGDYSLCLKTTDGGNTWTPVVTTSGNNIYYDICLVNAQTIFIAGTYNVKTTNGGNNWFTQWDIPESYSVTTDVAGKKVLFSGGGGMLGTNGRTLVATIDNGTTYQQLSASIHINYSDIFFLNDSTGYLAGYNQLYKTSDYAESWKPLITTWPAFGYPVRNMFFVDEQHGYAATDNIYKTNNGGSTWVPTASPDGQSQFYSNRMHFFDALQGLTINNAGIYRTLNGGSSWSLVQTAPTNVSFQDIGFAPNGKGVAVGYSGSAFISSDYGAHWSVLPLNTSDYLSSVYFYNNNRGFIGTTDSTLYKTTDGGATWVKINTGIHVPLRSFLFVNDTTGYLLVGNPGGLTSIYKTKDGGTTWFWLSGQANGGILTRLVGKTNVYSAGNSGMIIKTDRLRAPGIPGYIYGPSLHCQHSKSIFNTGLLQGLNYNWSLSGGGTNVFKQNLDTVLWNAPGSYTLSVSLSNVCGTGPERQITIPVNAATVINSQPVSATVCAGSAVTFSVEASGSSLTYQWKKGGQSISGAITNTYALSNIVAADSAFYSVEVSGLCGVLTSAPAKLRVLPADSCITPVSSINRYITSAMLMPNVVTNHTILKVIARQNTNTDWTILNGSGKVVLHFSSRLFYGENKLNLSLQQLPAGIYYLRGTMANNNSQSLKFIKL
jgi:photosystem II stability/assembly factor-like uncharacterized protein